MTIPHWWMLSLFSAFVQFSCRAAGSVLVPLHALQLGRQCTVTLSKRLHTPTAVFERFSYLFILGVSQWHGQCEDRVLSGELPVLFSLSGMVDIARQTVEFLYEENGGIPRDLYLPTIEDIKDEANKFTIDKVRKGFCFPPYFSCETSYEMRGSPKHDLAPSSSCHSPYSEWRDLFQALPFEAIMLRHLSVLWCPLACFQNSLAWAGWDRTVRQRESGVSGRFQTGLAAELINHENVVILCFLGF